MKTKRYALGLTLGLGLLLSSIGFAQTITQTEQKKTADSCCAMACCNHDSASMKHSKDDSRKHESCCSGDSCDTKMKENMKHHEGEAGCCCCSGDSCDMKMKEGMNNHAAGADCCCCGGDSCDLKMKDGAMKQAAGASCCCCGGDSCEMHKDMKPKEKKAN